MSSRKRLCLRSASKRRKSFDVRFCDDLCEVIVQYLSLEDKLRLECVSKQFQRTVFQKQYELSLENMAKMKGFRTNNNIDLKSFEIVLKKCPNIRSIDLNSGDNFLKNSDYSQNTHRMIELIARHCTVFERIRKLSVNFRIHEKLANFASLRHLILRMTSSWDMFDVIKGLNDVSALKDLRQLEVYGKSLIGSKFYDSFKVIANQCQKLMSFGFDYHIFNNKSVNLAHTLSKLKAIKELKRLKLRLWVDFDYSPDHNLFEAFKQLSDITHFSLSFCGSLKYKAINKSVIKGIAEYLPKLQYLEIENRFDTSVDEIHEFVEILNRLSSLHTIKLRFSEEEVMDQIRQQMDQKSKCFPTLSYGYSND